MSSSRRSNRFFTALLRAYPPSFRAEYGLDAAELFADRLRDARTRGPIAVAWLWAKTVPHMLIHGWLERRAHADGSAREIFRSALRSAIRAPGLTATIVLTLGVGIGATVGLYAVLRAVLLTPLPYPDASELVQMWETNPSVDQRLHGPSPWNFVDWERESRSFEHVAAWYLTSGTYRTEAWVEELRSAQVTADFFRTMGVEPMLGRDFARDEVQGYGPVMLSHGVWLRLFAGDPTVVGRTIIADGNSYEIVGVMPPDFTFPDPSVETWVAWDLRDVYEDNPDARTWRFLGGIGRRADGVSTESAEEELQAVAAGLAGAYPRLNAGWSAEVTELHEDVVGDVRATLWLAFASVLIILMIACANVTNLLLARVPARLRDLSVRTALGASRVRIGSELLMEHTLLGLLAGAVGLCFGRTFIGLLTWFDAGRIPRLEEVSLAPGVFAFTAVVAVCTSVIFGSAPLAMLLRQASAPARASKRTTAGKGHVRTRETFVAAQLAFALVLLVGAGVFSQSLLRLASVDPGFHPESVAAFRLSLDPEEGTSEEIVTYYAGLLDALASVRGVERVGAAQTLALNPIGNDFRRPFRPLGSSLASSEASTVQMRIVTDGYMETLGMRFLSGEVMPPRAALDDPLVAVVNETLARELFPGGSAVGQSFELDFRGGWQPYRITGVVADVRHYGLRADVAPEVFLAHGQMPYLAMNVVVKTAGEPEAFFGPLKDAVLGHLPMQPAHDFVSMEELVRASTAEERFLAVLLRVFSAVGLLLSVTGVYGVIAYTVGHRRREIGVRMALGADPESVVRSVCVGAARIGGIGVVVGLVGVVVLGRIVEGLLFGVSGSDPLTVTSVVVLLLSLATVAAWLPARRAARVPPSVVLGAD
ncbi:MAG: ABC transporter permease [Gemmatimonadota bacterium]